MRTLYRICPSPRQHSNWSFHVHPSLMSQEFRSDEFFCLFLSQSTTNWVVELILCSLKKHRCDLIFWLEFVSIIEFYPLHDPEGYQCLWTTNGHMHPLEFDKLKQFDSRLVLVRAVRKFNKILIHDHHHDYWTHTCSSLVLKSGYGRKLGLLPTGKSSGT